MGHLILVSTVSIISVIAFTYLPVNGLMHKDGVPKPTKDFLIPYYKGMAYLEIGNYTEAIPYFDKALASNPNYTLALNNKGAALYGLGIYNESIAYFDKALSVNPAYTTALYNKGAALSKLGIYNESIAYFDKVLGIQPTNALALAGKKLDLAAFSKTNIIAKPAGPQSNNFGYYFQKRATTPPPSYLTNAHTQKLTVITSKQSASYTGGEAHAQTNMTSSNASATAAGGANMTQPIVPPKQSS